MALQLKRFIAGAICPKCKAMDSVMLYMQNDVEKLECIECGYQESQDDQATTTQNDSVIGVFKPE